MTVGVGFYILFWSLITNSSKEAFPQNEVIAYFIMTNFVGRVTMSRFHGGFAMQLNNWIGSGKVSELMIRPIKVAPAILAYTIGHDIVNYIFSAIFAVVAIIINPPASLLGIGLFFLYLVLGFTISYSISTLLGAVAFITPEASSVRMAVAHVVNVISGGMVPIFFFPENLQKILNLTPFPSMIYGPINALTIKEFDTEIILNLLVTISWLAVLLLLSTFVWKKLLKKYEAVGI